MPGQKRIVNADGLGVGFKVGEKGADKTGVPRRAVVKALHAREDGRNRAIRSRKAAISGRFAAPYSNSISAIDDSRQSARDRSNCSHSPASSTRSRR